MTRLGAEVHPFVTSETLDRIDAAAKRASQSSGEHVGRPRIAAEVLRMWADGELVPVAERDDARSERDLYLKSIRAAWGALDENNIPAAYDALDVD